LEYHEISIKENMTRAAEDLKEIPLFCSEQAWNGDIRLSRRSRNVSCSSWSTLQTNERPAGWQLLEYSQAQLLMQKVYYGYYYIL